MSRETRPLPKGPLSQGRPNQYNVSSSPRVIQDNKLKTPIDGDEKPSLISTVQLSRPYLTRQQIKHAQSRTISNISIYGQRRNQIFHFLLKICVSLKFPMRCLESAMIYYQRYYLYNEFDTSSYYDIAITALFITSHWKF